MKTTWTLLAVTVAAAAVPPDNRLTLLSETPELRLVDGTGSVMLSFRKANAVALPKVVVDDMTDALGNVVQGASFFSARWTNPSAPEAAEAFVSLQVSTIKALPQLETKTRLLFQWTDGLWHTPLIVKSVGAGLSNRLTPVTQELKELPVLDGHGEPIHLTFAKSAGVKRPEQILIRSPREGNVVLRADQFETAWEGAWPDWRDAGTVTLRIMLKEGAVLPPFGRATGQVVFKWREGESTPVSFAVADASTRQFTVEPATLVVNLAWRQPPEISLNVTNTGTASINRLTITGSEFRDEGGRRVTFPKTVWPQGGTAESIGKSQVEVVKLALPQPAFAGSYQGAVYVSANGSAPKVVTLTIKTRGPFGQSAIPWPLILFFSTLLLGYTVARLLEWWLDLGGKERTETLLGLAGAASAMRVSYNELAEYRTGMPKVISNAETELHGIDEDLRNTGKSVEQLKAARDLAVRVAANLAFLVLKLKVVRENRPEALAEALRKLDALDLQAADYESKVGNELGGLATTSSRPDESSGTSGAVKKEKKKAEPETPEEISKKLKRDWWWMEGVYAVTTFVVVFVVAYLTVYYKEPDYGQVNDHLQTLLYGLGLSTAGTQILNKARSSTVKTA